MSDRYRVEQLPNGLIRVFDLASKLAGCYTADGDYHHGDLRAATIDALLASAERDYLIIRRIQRTPQLIEEGMSQ